MSSPESLRVLLVHEGTQITINHNALINMTAIHRCAPDAPPRFFPGPWIRRKATQDFLREFADAHGVGTEALTAVYPGGFLRGTWGHWIVALQYARALGGPIAQAVEGRIRWIWGDGNSDLNRFGGPLEPPTRVDVIGRLQPTLSTVVERSSVENSNVVRQLSPDYNSAESRIGPIVLFTYGGVDVVQDGDELVNLTRMWEADGRPENRDPSRWRRLPSADRFVRELAAERRLPLNRVFVTRRGRNAATWAHWQVAMVYAEHLSTAFHRRVHEVFRGATHATAAPPAPALPESQRARQSRMRRLGQPAGTIAVREDGVPIRKDLMRTISECGCTKTASENPFAELSNLVTRVATGATSGQHRRIMGLARTANMRDHFDAISLAKIMLFEHALTEQLQVARPQGNEACREVWERAAIAFEALLQSLYPDQLPPAPEANGNAT